MAAKLETSVQDYIQVNSFTKYFYLSWGHFIDVYGDHNWMFLTKEQIVQPYFQWKKQVGLC